MWSAKMRWKWGGEAVKDEDEGDVREEGERDGVFKVMEVIGGDGEVRVKGLVVA